jgi:hypothetical protein
MQMLFVRRCDAMRCGSLGNGHPHAAPNGCEAPPLKVHGRHRIKLASQQFGLEVEDSANRVEGKKIVLAAKVDPLPHFIQRPLMPEATTSCRSRIASDRIFQNRE